MTCAAFDDATFTANNADFKALLNYDLGVCSLSENGYTNRRTNMAAPNPIRCAQTDKTDCLVSTADNATCLLCKPQFLLVAGACTAEVADCYRMGADNKCLNCVDGHYYKNDEALDTAVQCALAGPTVSNCTRMNTANNKCVACA